MRALCAKPGIPASAMLLDCPEPPRSPRRVLVETLEIGVCGTDREIVAGAYGWAPPGEERLILGHESVGRVLEAPQGCPFQPGDLVIGIVRQPDPVPCANCAVGEWDMCRNGLYAERGIKGLHGFCRERYSIEPEFLVKIDPRLRDVGVLVETASVLAKAWEHIERIGSRSLWKPRRLLVTGAGPVGLLAALMGVQRGLEVHVLDQVGEGTKPLLARKLGAAYHVGTVEAARVEPDIVIECTGAGQLVLDVVNSTGPNGIVCLTGVSSGGRTIPIDPGALNRNLVLENDVIFGSVNANRRHYEKAISALSEAPLPWLGELITRRVPLSRWHEAFERSPSDIKRVITGFS